MLNHCFEFFVCLFVFFKFRDRFRTTINVMCDSIGAILVDHLSKRDLKDADFEHVILKIATFMKLNF